MSEDSGESLVPGPMPQHHESTDFGLRSSSSSAASTNSKSTCAQREEGFLACQVGSLCMLPRAPEGVRVRGFGGGRAQPEQAGARKHETQSQEIQSKHGQGARVRARHSSPAAPRSHASPDSPRHSHFPMAWAAEVCHCLSRPPRLLQLEVQEPCGFFSHKVNRPAN